MTLNPYEPSAHTTTPESTSRLHMVAAGALIVVMSLVAGACVAFACVAYEGNDRADIAVLLVFFMSLGTVFGFVGTYVGRRHIQGRASLWSIPTAIGAIAMILTWVSYSSTASVVNWIALLAAACALIASTIAARFASLIRSQGLRLRTESLRGTKI